MSGTTQHTWLQGDDDLVRQKLNAALIHAKGGGTPSEIIGSPPPGQYRKAFLKITKTYHPNRFARRPDDIRALANEVYILLKEAFEKVQEAAETLERDEVLRKAKEATKKAPRQSTASLMSDADKPNKKGTLPDPAVLATRRALMNRRQEKLKQRTLEGSGKRTAQVRAATDPQGQESDAVRRKEEEVRFERAVNQMRITDFLSAASTFKELAVGRPSEKRYRMHMHYAQGRLQQSNGQLEEARAEYKRALGLDANFAEAHQAMETLPGGNTPKSLLKKFFKK